MVRLTPPQARLLADTLRQLANIVIGAAVVGQFVRPEPLSPWVAGAGIAAWWVLVGFALAFAFEGERDD